MERMVDEDRNEEFASIEDIVSRIEEDPRTQKSCVERARSSVHPKVESLMQGDVSATSSGATSSSPSTPSSCLRILSSDLQEAFLQNAATFAQEESHSTTSIGHGSSVANPRRTSVTEAAESGDAEALRRLLANGEDANTLDSNGVPALHLAASRGHDQAVGALLDGGANVNIDGPGLRKALHEATMNGHVDVVRRLLDAGSKLEVKDVEGNTPLMLAVKDRQWQIALLLVAKGADSNATVFEGKSALTVAIADGDLETVNMMLHHKKPFYVYIPLSYVKNVNAVRVFEDAVPGLTTREGAYAMIVAARNGRLESMVVLLEAGVDIDTKDGNQWTALMWASSNGHVECVKELVRRGADLDAATTNGSTALHWASWNGRGDVVRVLLDAGAKESGQSLE